MSHTECTEFLEQIVYWLDNELDESDVAEVRVHLDGCGPCHDAYDLQRAIKSVVARSCAERAPAELRAKVLLSIRQVSLRVTDSAPGSGV